MFYYLTKGPDILRLLRMATQKNRGITASSTAEYFSKNLQQVGFSSPTKAVLTTVKEALDNSLDACEDHGILPDIEIVIEKIGAGSLKNTDKIRILVRDNGPGIEPEDVAKVFGEYLASSKFGRGRCSRGQQGIGISAATTWALQTTATGAKVITKKKAQRKAIRCSVEMDLKNNKGLIKDKETIDWQHEHGTQVEFLIDGRVQLNGEAGLTNYILGNVLVNPHMRLTYMVPGMDKPKVIDRVSDECPVIPEAIEPHPHTMKLGEFISHARVFGNVKVKQWLKTGFSRLGDKTISDLMKEAKLKASTLEEGLQKIKDEDIQKLFVAIQNHQLNAPSTNSVLSIGEAHLAKSLTRIGEVDFFAVVSRKPTICDFKPVQIEVAIARLLDRNLVQDEDTAHVLRFANRVPLQFDKGGCAVVKAITSINWKSYGLKQSKNSIPCGPYVICVSVVSPFIKFKNASKETIDASDELVEELRRALMQAGQRLSTHIRREHKEAELEERLAHIEKFGPVLVETLARITGANQKRKDAAELGLKKILGRDTKVTAEELSVADKKLEEHKAKRKERLGFTDVEDLDESTEPKETESADEKAEVKKKPKKAAKPAKAKKK
jgi:DNA topoisomerase VI subunit B